MPPDLCAAPTMTTFFAIIGVECRPISGDIASITWSSSCFRSTMPSFPNVMVDLKQDDDQVIDAMSPEIGLHSTPMIAKNVVIVGDAHKSGGIPTGKTNVKGYVRGFDVRTGKRLW